MPQHRKDINGNEIIVGDKVKLTTRAFDYNSRKNEYGFQNGIGIVTNIEQDHWVYVNGNVIGWNSKILEIIPQNLYQHILRSI